MAQSVTRSFIFANNRTIAEVNSVNFKLSSSLRIVLMIVKKSKRDCFKNSIVLLLLEIFLHLKWLMLLCYQYKQTMHNPCLNYWKSSNTEMQPFLAAFTSLRQHLEDNESAFLKQSLVFVSCGMNQKPLDSD